MSITNYAELQTAVAAWVNRADLTAQLPDFITLAEAKLNRRLRTRAQETALSSTAPDSSYQIAVPATAVAVKQLWIDSLNTWRIEQKPLDYVIQNQTPGKRPVYYAWSGTNWIFDGSGGSVTGVYYAKVPALSAGANWLIGSTPDLYLYATVEQAAVYLQNADLALGMKALTESLIDELNGISAADQISGGKLIARAR